MARVTGRYLTSTVHGEVVRAFVPHPLPPSDPPLAIRGELADRVDAAERSLLRLSLASEMVPSLEWFVYGFVRKEAVLSSQIEGTQATLIDLLEYEAGDRDRVAAPDADIEEVCNYLDALNYALGQMRDPNGLPLSIRLLHETHRVLLRGVRGEHKQPGERRRSQNWIGGSRPGTASFVPPPPTELADLLSDMERYVYEEDGLPSIVRAGLLHVQFETIHPYLDGNGRIGRLLITLLLEQWRLLEAPLLYLSLYFKRHRLEYYRRLDAVRRDGDWEGWLGYFLDGVATVADESVAAARQLHALVAADRERLLEIEGVNLLAVQLFERLPERPFIDVTWIVDELASTKPTAGRAIAALERAGILHETTGKKRDRVYAYRSYLDVLRAGTELSGI